jgi:hypothetical protein
MTSGALAIHLLPSVTSVLIDWQGVNTQHTGSVRTLVANLGTKVDVACSLGCCTRGLARRIREICDAGVCFHWHLSSWIRLKRRIFSLDGVLVGFWDVTSL